MGRVHVTHTTGAACATGQVVAGRRPRRSVVMHRVPTPNRPGMVSPLSSGSTRCVRIGAPAI